MSLHCTGKGNPFPVSSSASTGQQNLAIRHLILGISLALRIVTFLTDLSLGEKILVCLTLGINLAIRLPLPADLSILSISVSLVGQHLALLHCVQTFIFHSFYFS